MNTPWDETVPMNLLLQAFVFPDDFVGLINKFDLENALSGDGTYLPGADSSLQDSKPG